MLKGLDEHTVQVQCHPYVLQFLYFLEYGRTLKVLFEGT